MKKVSVVVINLKTGKPYKGIPRKKTNVQYAIQGPRGGLKLLRKEPQEFFKSDLDGLNQAIQNTGGKNFIVYEQKTRKNSKEFKKDGTPKKLTKITFAQPRRSQKPVLYVRGSRQRDLDLGFKQGNYKRARTMRKLIIAKPNVYKPYHIILKGKTIKQALDGLQVDVDVQRMLKNHLGLYYSVIVKITTPSGEIIRVPANGSHLKKLLESIPITAGNENVDLDRSGNRIILDNHLALPNEPRALAYKEAVHVDGSGIVANLQAKLSTSIRYAIKSVGYRFTSLKVLQQYAAKGKSVMQMNDVDVKNLKQITSKYTVELFVKFEVM